MFKKGKVVILTIVIISVILIGLIYKSYNKPKVVVVLKNLDTQYFEIVKSGVEQGFKDFGINGEVVGPDKESAEEQARILKKLYQEKPDVLIVSPISSSIIPILDKFTKEKHIPVLLMDQNNPWPNKTAYVGADNVDLGKKAGSLLSSELHPGNKVAIIAGNLSVPVFKDRIMGAKIALKNSGMIVAEEKVGVPDDLKMVRKEVNQILIENPNLQGFIATHDNLAYRIIKVLKEEDRVMPVIGADGIPDMVKYIEDGTISATVAQNPFDMGHLAVETALKVIKGENVKKIVDTGVDIVIQENAQERLDFYKKMVRFGTN
ncbi:substrate-binding domain-containing protein [Neobacillus cucumis]|uniref:sugar ABC transporter substrate-binding protein n=1 Tax=Neobacillus cucumis TaxID=1740721 RepID=UPI0018E02871|nr:substrate-binding domain-containing protein [Neobacillus cucumis]MBI0577245.1 substrate-binding domain-containing protein [Neobacillus cucumis]WHY94307.1 substrate-binding domain-containing protein [Neobacillus cucumis]